MLSGVMGVTLVYVTEETVDDPGSERAQGGSERCE